MNRDKMIEVKKLIEEYDTDEFIRRRSFYVSIGMKPHLAVAMAGEDKGSISYMKGIRRFCSDHGISFSAHQSSTGEELAAVIMRLNEDEDVDGIMVMYPTPFEQKDTYYMNLVSPDKDVEGLHALHLGYLIQYEKYRDMLRLKKLVIPPTAKGILYIFKRYYELYENQRVENGSYPFGRESNPFRIEGSRFTIINDSLAVGRSLALMLLNENGSVRICHKYTDREEILNLCRQSDVIISAVPGGDFIIPTEHIKKDSVIVDISFGGNFEYPSIMERASMIAPRWNLMEKGNRINDMTLYRLISNLHYLIDAKLPADILRKWGQVST